MALTPLPTRNEGHMPQHYNPELSDWEESEEEEEDPSSDAPPDAVDVPPDAPAVVVRSEQTGESASASD